MNTFTVWLEETRKGFLGKLFKDGVLSMKLFLLGGLGIALLLAGTVFEVPSAAPKKETAETAKTVQFANRSYEEVLEGRLYQILSQMRGAGAVSVSVTLENGGFVEHAKNIVRETKTIQEKDQSGGTRTTTEAKETEQILVSKEGAIDKPVLVREHKPVIKGVLVIAEGAQDSLVKASLTKAIETGLGIPSYKITVLPHRK